MRTHDPSFIISQEDPRVRHARALFVLALFILLVGQLLPELPYSTEKGWTLWTRLGADVKDAFHKKADYASLLLDGLCVTSVALIAAAPIFMHVFARSAPLRWTARVLAAGTWAAWLLVTRSTSYLGGGENCILAGLIVVIAGLARLPAEERPAAA